MALKGSALVLLDPASTSYARPSTDLDITASCIGPADLQDLLARAAAEAEAHGIRYEFGRTRTLYKPNGTAGGEKTKVVAWLGRTRVNFEVDAWFGGTRCPGMRVREAASIVPGLPPLRMLAYPPESTVADKLHAIVQFGSANTRLKDYYDLWHLAGRDLDSALLSECVEATFGNNGRSVPALPSFMPGLGQTFAVANRDMWTAMLEAAGRQDHAPADFADVVTRVRAFANRAFGPTPVPKESRSMRDSFAAEPAPNTMSFAC